MRKKVLISIISVLVICAIGIVICFASGVFNKTKEFDKNDFSTFLDENRRPISKKDTKKISEGMSFAEVVDAIGRPKRSVGSGRYIVEWDMIFGNIFRVYFSPVTFREDRAEGDCWIVAEYEIDEHPFGWVETEDTTTRLPLDSDFE